MTKLLECMQNPANMMKYMDNPIIKKLMTKLMGGMGGGGGGFPFSAGGIYR
jgi:hypothetical protein